MKYKLGFIGCGNMAGAILDAVTKKGVFSKENIIVYDINTNTLGNISRQGIDTAKGPEYIAEEAEYIILGVKPNAVAGVAAGIAPLIKENTVIISIAAGVKLSALKGYFGDKAKLLRVMPNLPALTGEGATALCTEHSLDESQWNTAQSIFGAIGKIFLLEEKHMDTVTALTGSGPAMVFMFIDALADSAVMRGIPKNIASEMAVQMVLGSAKLLQDSSISPAEWKDKVCSPGGTTIEAVYSLHKSGFTSSVMDAVAAAAEKSEKLGK